LVFFESGFKENIFFLNLRIYKIKNLEEIGTRQFYEVSMAISAAGLMLM